MTRILPIFITFAACGNRCIFCDQNVISGIKEKEDILDSAVKQLNIWLQRRKDWDEVAFFGGNFGALPKNIRLDLFNLVRLNGIKKIRYSTRPDTVTEELLGEIKDQGIDLVELGIQSLSDDVLRLNGRPYDRKRAIKAIEDISNISSCGVQLMTGMYGQSYISAVDDAQFLSNMNVKTARIYPTVVIKGTPLEKIMNDGKYNPTILRDTIASGGGMYIYFIGKNIPVIRMGLPYDGDLENNIVGGSVHRSFGDLIKTFIASLYCERGKRVSFAGFKGYVRQKYGNLFDIMVKTDFNEICSELRSLSFEDNRWYFEEQAYRIACELEGKAYHR